MGVPTNFIWIITVFGEAFKYGNCAKFLGYVRENAESFCVEFCTMSYISKLINFLLND
jgi:hypothetical protein